MGSKLLGVRLPQNIHNKLEKLATQMNSTPNQVAKNAIIEWIEVLYTSRNLNMVILPKEAVRMVLDLLPDEQLGAFTEKIADNLVNFYQFMHTTHLNYIEVEDFMNLTIKFIGGAGLMWCDHLEFEHGEDKSFLKVFHNFGQKWSNFLVHLMRILLDKYFQITIKDSSINILPNSLYFEFQQELSSK